MDIEYTSNTASWECQGRIVNINLEKIIWGTFYKDQDIVVLEIGEGFKASDYYYYYSIDGKFLAKYNLVTGEVIWYHNGEHQLSVPCTETIGFYPEHDLLLIIYRISEERNSVTAMKVFNLNGDLVHSINSPEGYTMVYITGIEANHVKIVCDATIEENVDPYGRDRFHFLLDLITGEWEKTGLAY